MLFLTIKVFDKKNVFYKEKKKCRQVQ